MESIDKRQVKAVRKASGMDTFEIMLEMNDFYHGLLTKGERKDELAKLARVVYDDKQKPQKHASSTKNGFVRNERTHGSAYAMMGAS